eukprot:COSAG01_NODE_8851_length_2637_cov_6.265957_4_plen_152_part_00
MICWAICASVGSRARGCNGTVCVHTYLIPTRARIRHCLSVTGSYPSVWNMCARSSVPTPAGSGESQALLSRVVAACCVTHDCTRHARLGFAMQAHLAAVAQTTRHIILLAYLRPWWVGRDVEPAWQWLWIKRRGSSQHLPLASDLLSNSSY